MELIQKTIRYNQEGKKIFDQFYLDEDYNVPDDYLLTNSLSTLQM